MMEYNFLDNSFTTFEGVETPRKVYKDYPLGGFDFSTDLVQGITPSGTPVVADTTNSENNNYQEIIDKMSESHSEEIPYNNSDSQRETKHYSKASKDTMDRAVKVAKYLVDNGNFTKEQAAAVAGVMIDENKVDPSSYMKSEKEGKGARGTGGFGYGAGIGSWTFESTKNELLKQGGYKPYTPIEKLSLEEQSRLFVLDSNGRMKRYYDALRRCNNLEDASATAVLITGGIGKSKNWDTHPTRQEAKALSDWYGRSNDRRFGKSPYHWDLDKRRLAYAKQVLERL